MLMAWCFSTRASVARVLTTHPCISRCLRVKIHQLGIGGTQKTGRCEPKSLIDMMTSSNGNIFRVTGPLCGEFTGEFPSQRPVTWSFGVFFDLSLNKRLSKQSWHRWFEMSLHPLWGHCNDVQHFCIPPELCGLCVYILLEYLPTITVWELNNWPLCCSIVCAVK